MSSTFLSGYPLAAPQAQRAVNAFDVVYDEYFPFVWRCLRGLGVPHDVVDDATQDVFLVVHRRLADFKGESTLKTWLFGIVRNVASNHRRSIVRKGRTEAFEFEPVTDEPDPHGHLEERQAADFVQAFLDATDERKRALFVLTVLEEMSVPEAAAALGVPLNTAYTRLRRVRADFRKALAERKTR